jgi:hypothetical protein
MRVVFSQLVFASLVALLMTFMSQSAAAGPPFQSDDPEPTDYRHFEIYGFADGSVARDAVSGESGIDINYGATQDLQLTAVLPLGFDTPASAKGVVNLGRIELASKYRFAHQQDVGVDIAVFPRVFLPAGSPEVGERHLSLLLPIWVEKDWGKWSLFGGGGCVLDRSSNSQDFCLTGWTVMRQVLPNMMLGVEVFHQGANAKGGRATTTAGAGFKYDLSENYHLLGYIAPAIQNASATNRYVWYGSVLWTF